LAELEVAETDALHGGEDSENAGEVNKEFCSFRNGHFKHIGNGLPTVFDQKGFAIVTFALAVFALDIDIGQKVHLNFPGSCTLTHFAPATFDIKAEPPGFVSPDLRFGHAGKEIADKSEYACIGCRIGSRRAADGRLVDVDYLIDITDSFNAVVGIGKQFGSVEMTRKNREKGFVDDC